MVHGRWRRGGGRASREVHAGSPSATAEAVDVSVGDFRAAMAPPGWWCSTGFDLSLAAAGRTGVDDEDEGKDEDEEDEDDEGDDDEDDDEDDEDGSAATMRRRRDATIVPRRIRFDETANDLFLDSSSHRHPRQPSQSESPRVPLRPARQSAS